MKKSSSGISRRSTPRRSVSRASSAISAGGRSPIGEPLAMLPPTVPALRIWMEAKRRISSPRSGCRRASAAVASRWLTRRAERQPVLAFLDDRKVFHARHIDQSLQVPMLLGDPEPDVGRAGDQHRVGMLQVDLRELVGRARREDLRVAMREMQHRALARACRAASRSRERDGASGPRRASRLESRIDDRPVAGAAAEIAGEPVLHAPAGRSARPRASRHRAA